MGRHRLPDGEAVEIPLGFRVHRAAAERIDRLARERGQTRSEFLRAAFEEALSEELETSKTEIASMLERVQRERGPELEEVRRAVEEERERARRERESDEAP